MSDAIYKKALVPVHDSDLSDQVIVSAIKLVKVGIVEELVLLSVWDTSRVDYTKLHAADKEEMIKEEAEAVLAYYKKLMEDAGVSRVSATRAGGDPAEVILEMTDDKEEYDFIIMGSRRLNKIQEIIYGSVSDKVSRMARIPVLIIK